MWPFLRPDSIQVLGDEKCRRSLSRYFDVFNDRKQAKFQLAKKLAAEFTENESNADLWEQHQKLTEEYLSFEAKADRRDIDLEDIEQPKRSYLDLKIEIANRILSECHLCERNDKPNRLAGDVGFCRCGTEPVVSTFFEHMGEEPELVPSGTIFTLGCTLRCLHCQNWTISQWFESGEILSIEQLSRIVEKLRRGGCRNANLVGGEPTPWLKHWLEVFRLTTVNVPVVWNSNSYYSLEVARLLAGFSDVYLLDFKYGPRKCADRISSAPRYWDVCTRNHLVAAKYGELIIRVLVLPQHLECCTKPILRWIAENLGVDVRVNIMFQYRPEWRAYEIPELGRRLTREERSRALELAKEAGLRNYIT